MVKENLLYPNSPQLIIKIEFGELINNLSISDEDFFLDSINLFIKELKSELKKIPDDIYKLPTPQKLPRKSGTKFDAALIKVVTIFLLTEITKSENIQYIELVLSLILEKFKKYFILDDKRLCDYCTNGVKVKLWDTSNSIQELKIEDEIKSDVKNDRKKERILTLRAKWHKK